MDISIFLSFILIFFVIIHIHTYETTEKKYKFAFSVFAIPCWMFLLCNFFFALIALSLSKELFLAASLDYQGGKRLDLISNFFYVVLN